MKKLVKGSPEAMAWAKKMKKARIRAAGKRTEQEFFGPGGHFADEAATKHRTNPIRTHQLTNEEADKLWKYVHSIKNRGKHRYAFALAEYVIGGQRGLGPNWKSYGIGIMTEQAVRQQFAALVPALMRYDENPRKHPAAGKFRKGISAYDLAVQQGFPYIRGNGHASKGVWYNRFTKTADGSGPALYVGWNDKTRRWLIYGDEPLHKGIPGVGQTPEENPDVRGYIEQEGWKSFQGTKGILAFSRTVGSLFQILQNFPAQKWRILYRTFLTPQSDPAQLLGTYDMLDKALIAANRQANDWARKKNPITIVGNPPNGHGCPEPPARFDVGVEGVLYCNVLEVAAEKKVKYKGFWYHPYKAKSRVQMLALDNGDLLIHSVNGTPLWKRD